MPYLWIKALHVLAVISWMVGQLYLPRLFVYHAGVAPGSEADGLFAVMERRLLRGIMLPAMLATYGFGIWLILLLGPEALKTAGWLHVKLLFVLLLTLMHGWMARERRMLASGARPHTARFYRIINEVPAVFLVVIVLLVIIKPF